MTEPSTQLGGHVRLRGELLKSARLLERMGGFLQGIVVVIAAAGVVAAIVLAAETDCATSTFGPSGSTTCVSGTTHPHVALAFGLGIGVVLAAIALVALLQLMVVIAKYCAYTTYGSRSDWIAEPS